MNGTRMKWALLLATAMLVSLSWQGCKKDPGSHRDEKPQLLTDEERLFHSVQVLQAVVEKATALAVAMKPTAPELLEHTLRAVHGMEGVEDVHLFDDAHLKITTEGGFTTTLTVDTRGGNGLSTFRGGTSGVGALVAIGEEAETCSSIIEEKGVLLFSAHHNEFYLDATQEFERNVIDVIQKADKEIEIDFFKNEECTIDVLLGLGNYGLAILDMHGEKDGIVTGTNITFTAGQELTKPDVFLEHLGRVAGEHNVPHFKNGNLTFTSRLFLPEPDKWENPEELDKFLRQRTLSVVLASKGIRELLPDLSNTVLFSNACYSAWMAAEFEVRRLTGKDTVIIDRYENSDPVGKAWLSKNPRAFFGYEAAMQGVSYAVPNDFCKENEYRFVKALFDSKDSTGVAHLKNGSIAEIAWYRGLFRRDLGPLQFRQYASPSWCYSDCGVPFTDPRDGQEYPTVCIGKQVWMAKNLNWAGRGQYYDQDPSRADGYGRLYTWEEATGGVFSDNGKPVQGGCPVGWHIPSKAEWLELIRYAGGEAIAGTKLKARALWENWTANSDDFGFSMTPAGECSTYEGVHDCANEDVLGVAWTTTRDDGGSGEPLIVEFTDGAGIHIGQSYMDTPRFSIRCIKDK